MMRITPAYEGFLATFAREYPAFFWQLNFWALAGGIAIGMGVVEVVIAGTVTFAPWVRLLVYVIPAAIGAQVIQRRYKQRAIAVRPPQAPTT